MDLLFRDGRVRAMIYISARGHNWVVRKQVVAGYMLKLTRVRMVRDDTTEADGGCGVGPAALR